MPCSSQAMKFNVASQVAAVCQGEAVVEGKYAESISSVRRSNLVSLLDTVNRGLINVFWPAIEHLR